MNLTNLLNIDTTSWEQNARTVSVGVVDFMKQTLSTLSDIRDNTEQVQGQRRVQNFVVNGTAKTDMFRIEPGTAAKIEYVSHVSDSAQIVRLLVNGMSIYASGTQAAAQNVIFPIAAAGMTIVTVQAAGADNTEWTVVYSVFTPEPRKGNPTKDTRLIDDIGTIGMDKHRPQV